MRSDAEVLNLYADFPELTGDEINWHKELYAHFGLLFSGFALLEASLHNSYIFMGLSSRLASGKIRSVSSWTTSHDELERRAFSLSLGNLLKNLKHCAPIQGMMPELNELKRRRDYFAHHFFREELANFQSEEALIVMIAAINTLRRRVKLAEESCDEIGQSIIREVNPVFWDSLDLQKETSDYKAMLQREISDGGQTFGWEKL